MVQNFNLNSKTKYMQNEEKTPRTLEQLIAEFNASSGEFAKFHKELSEREKILFKGWLHQLRATPAVIK
jgi:hypothetical protein